MIKVWENGKIVEKPDGFIAPVSARPSPPKRYSKKALFEAMTKAEYDTFETVEAQQGKKDRRVFREATELNEADPSYPQFFGLMNSVYGEARTAELLAAAAL